jgi:copper chaperone CopZ
VHFHGWFWGWFSDISVILMILIILYATINHLSPKSKKIASDTKTADLSLIVKGMTCNHCKETATEAIQSCDGVEKISINLETGNTLIYGKSINETQVIESINSVGFSVSKFE